MHLRPGGLAQFLRVKQFCVNVLQFMFFFSWRIITHVLRPGGLAMEQSNWSLESLEAWGPILKVKYVFDLFLGHF